MTALAWIGLMVGGVLLGAELLGLIRPVLRRLGVIPVGKAAPPTPVSGIFALAGLLILIFLARSFGVGPVLLWVWVAAVGGLLLVMILGLLNRKQQKKAP